MSCHTNRDLRSYVSTYGGGATVQHWVLHVDGVFIADTSVPEQKALFDDIAHSLNWNKVLQDISAKSEEWEDTK